MKFKILYLILPFALAFGSCKKDTPIVLNDLSTVFVMDAVPVVSGVHSIKVNATGKPGSWATNTTRIVNGAGNFFPFYFSAGTVPITAVSYDDTTKVMFNKVVTLRNKKNYTMYVFGSTTTIDTMFREETNYPFIPLRVTAYAPADSVTNVRFVNLSYGSPALKINLLNSPVNEVENLPYKGITPFKAYANKVNTGTSYVFEIRDAASNALLATYTFQATITNQFRNVAIVIKGVFTLPIPPSTAAPFTIQTINYF